MRLLSPSPAASSTRPFLNDVSLSDRVALEHLDVHDVHDVHDVDVTNKNSIDSPKGGKGVAPGCAHLLCLSDAMATAEKFLELATATAVVGGE